MSWLLDGKGLEVLYKAQDRSSLEYACLAWGQSGQEKPLFLRQGAGPCRETHHGQRGTCATPHTLQHRRDVAGLIVVFKVQEKEASQLQNLRQPKRRAPVITRNVALAPSELLQPRCLTWHYQRHFINTYTRW